MLQRLTLFMLKNVMFDSLFSLIYSKQTYVTKRLLSRPFVQFDGIEGKFCIPFGARRVNKYYNGLQVSNVI